MFIKSKILVEFVTYRSEDHRCSSAEAMLLWFQYTFTSGTWNLLCRCCMPTLLTSVLYCNNRYVCLLQRWCGLGQGDDWPSIWWGHVRYSLIHAMQYTLKPYVVWVTLTPAYDDWLKQQLRITTLGVKSNSKNDSLKSTFETSKIDLYGIFSKKMFVSKQNLK